MHTHTHTHARGDGVSGGLCDGYSRGRHMKGVVPIAVMSLARAAAAAAILLLSCCILVLAVPPSAGQGSGCSCNNTNSRCDELGLCRCDPGWDGERCERCVPMPGCHHGACQQPWQCVCEAGWGGRFCDKDLAVCAEQRPCLHGATCLLEDSGEYACLCPEGFHGRNCQLRAGPCHRTRSPCKNGGLCEDADGFATQLKCRCLAGFTGLQCETNVDDCLMRPCANGATCVDGVNRFSCVCPTGFSGRFCTINLDDCASRPCLNAGRCLDRAGGFRCVCPPGFAGATCETPLRATPRWGAGGGATPHLTTSGGNRSKDGDRLLRVTVSERSTPILSEVQLVILLVMAGITLGALVLTAALVLQGHCRVCSHTPWTEEKDRRADGEGRQWRWTLGSAP